MNNFISWLDGFLTNKTALTEEEVSIIRKRMDTAKMAQMFPQVSDYDICPHPDSCGMPQAWWGIVPPICTKCGKQGAMPNITYCDGK